ncbi:MAG: hypothetical protein P1P76_12635, partial [Anaerolineales bacterium]|nr:hypothetical protein [Anaerolineales bacterium]
WLPAHVSFSRTISILLRSRQQADGLRGRDRLWNSIVESGGAPQGGIAQPRTLDHEPRHLLRLAMLCRARVTTNS